MSDLKALELSEATVKLLSASGEAVRAAEERYNLVLAATFAAAGLWGAQMQKVELVDGKHVLYYTLPNGGGS